jgi:hypothetical protein
VHTTGPNKAKPFRSPANPFLESVYHMACAYFYHKRKDKDLATQHMAQVTSQDWQRAGIEWLNRRWIKVSTAASNTGSLPA